MDAFRDTFIGIILTAGNKDVDAVGVAEECVPGRVDELDTQIARLACEVVTQAPGNKELRVRDGQESRQTCNSVNARSYNGSVSQRTVGKVQSDQELLVITAIEVRLNTSGRTELLYSAIEDMPFGSGVHFSRSFHGT